ncbi:hypothetical protein GPECTOR_33g655 [Gonium pectorale]|uniref:ADP,ATP carrier protein n=1 Tax=Gonium pectorale TaxID=33097 RepID=A0A150GDC0_GONPE|nr:hypothetical protein GPECTOR_33g655 [Gonium pectorale]|eukprot:KXZ47773.1 hypothetical protein GPECTOR_33g655 [Gonium pectorale]
MRSWFSYLYGYTLAPHEATAARHGFAAFGFLLSSYFILLPLREDVALSLGPSVLPRLFTVSLLVTAVAAPAVTAYVIDPARLPRAAGFGRLCKLMAGCLTALFLALLLTSPDPWVIARLLAPLQPGLWRAAAANAGHPAAPPPPAALTWYGNAVRVCFYVYLSLQSLLSTSAMWAVCADSFTPATSTKVYGFLGAGATLGQFTASAAALAFGAACKRTGASGAAVWLLLPAAGALLVAARYCQGMSRVVDAVRPLDDAHDQRPPYDGGEDPNRRRGGSWGGGASAAPELAGRGGKAAAGGGGGWQDRPSPGAAPSHASRLLEGFRLIAASPYLLAASAFLALAYATSATLYFLRAQTVAKAEWLGGSAERIAFFAALNTASAGLIFAAQVLLTGRVMTRLGVGTTLLVGPLVSLAGMAAVLAAPSASTVAAVEVLRKLVSYSLARPSREALFTLVSRREKYGAKLVLDTVVQRVGDTAAAGLFQLVAVQLSLGPAAVAAVGMALSGGHLALALALGRMYGRRRAAAAAAAAEDDKKTLHEL